MRQANITPFGLRMQPELRDRIAEAARRNSRSMNSEIVHRLEGGLDRETNGAFALWLPKDLRQRIEDVANRDELDPNLVIVSALEDAFPRERSMADSLRETALEMEREVATAPPERRGVLALSIQVIEELLAKEEEREQAMVAKPVPPNKSK